MAELTELEEVVIGAIRDGKEPDEILKEVEAVVLLAWNLKREMEGVGWLRAAEEDTDG